MLAGTWAAFIDQGAPPPPPPVVIAAKEYGGWAGPQGVDERGLRIRIGEEADEEVITWLLLKRKKP